MTKQEIVTSKAPPPTASYSQAIVANGLVWVCGQVGNTTAKAKVHKTVKLAAKNSKTSKKPAK